MQYDLYKNLNENKDIRAPFIKTINELQHLGYSMRSAKSTYEKERKIIEDYDKMREELRKTPSVFRSGRQYEYKGLSEEEKQDLDCCKMLFKYEMLLENLKRKNDFEKKMEEKAAEANLWFENIIELLKSKIETNKEKQGKQVEEYEKLKTHRDNLELQFKQKEKKVEEELDKDITKIDNLIREHEEQEIDPLNKRIRGLKSHNIREIERLKRLCSVERLIRRGYIKEI